MPIDVVTPAVQGSGVCFRSEFEVSRRHTSFTDKVDKIACKFGFRLSHRYSQVHNIVRRCSFLDRLTFYVPAIFF
jgi:hypothetical protein